MSSTTFTSLESSLRSVMDDAQLERAMHDIGEQLRGVVGVGVGGGAGGGGCQTMALIAMMEEDTDAARSS